MKKITILFFALSLTIFSCSSDDSPSENNEETPEFAMTAKINGTTFQANHPFGTNVFSNTTIWDQFPMEDFVLIQGRQGGIFGNPEINIWLKRSDIEVGTYAIAQETFETPPTHFIDLIDNSNDFSEYTNEGEIVITNVDTNTKIVTGTFEFNTVDMLENPAAPIGFTVTEGTFRYQYE
jgi:hypothetical protein